MPLTKNSRLEHVAKKTSHQHPEHWLNRLPSFKLSCNNLHFASNSIGNQERLRSAIFFTVVAPQRSVLSYF